LLGTALLILKTLSVWLQQLQGDIKKYKNSMNFDRLKMLTTDELVGLKLITCPHKLVRSYVKMHNPFGELIELILKQTKLRKLGEVKTFLCHVSSLL
jgi:hypothetical protein